jgi:hypothetical protein
VQFQEYFFGSIRIDGVTYDHDLIVDRGRIRKRKKAGCDRRADRPAQRRGSASLLPAIRSLEATATSSTKGKISFRIG